MKLAFWKKQKSHDFGNSSLSDNNSYPAFCKNASIDSAMFENFRHNPIYTQILEHVSYEIGQQYLDIILERANFSEQDFKEFLRNDYWGGAY